MKEIRVNRGPALATLGNGTWPSPRAAPIFHLSSRYRGIQMYSTEQAVQKQCSSDAAVRLDTHPVIYHMKGERWYGRKQHSAYVCKMEADAASYRETENGQ